jgi:hypothetical protein
MMHYEYLAYHLQRVKEIEAQSPQNVLKSTIIVEFKDKLNLRKRRNPRRHIPTSSKPAA